MCKVEDEFLVGYDFSSYQLNADFFFFLHFLMLLGTWSSYSSYTRFFLSAMFSQKQKENAGWLDS